MYVPPHRRLRPELRGELPSRVDETLRGSTERDQHERPVASEPPPDSRNHHDDEHHPADRRTGKNGDNSRVLNAAPCEENAFISSGSSPKSRRFDQPERRRSDFVDDTVHHHHAADDPATPAAAVTKLCDRLDRIKCINLSARKDKWEQMKRQARRIGPPFADKIERFEAVNGDALLRQIVMHQKSGDDSDDGGVVQLEWDATRNAQYSNRVTASKKQMTAGEVGCAASHVQVWRELRDSTNANENVSWLVLEDDCAFAASSHDRRHPLPRFVPAFHLAWEQLPDDWDLLYLGFSSRGERIYVQPQDGAPSDDAGQSDLQVQLYRPTYGFHTHAYVVKKRAATVLLEQLPVVGPIDVWMADNQWWGLNVYCAVIANEGWKRPDGTYEGSNLVSQQKAKYSSDVPQSGDERRRRKPGSSKLLK